VGSHEENVVTSLAASTSLVLRRERATTARRQRAVPLALVAAWGVLCFNVLAFSTMPGSVLPIPRVVGQLLTQGALALALLLAFAVNRRGVLRPNLFLVLLSMMSIVSLAVSVHSEFLFGSTYRGARFVGFVAVLWLFTPWWGRRDMMLLRVHRRVLWIVLATVILGALIAPGQAFSFEGRLSGVLWPIPPTQVAHYAAVLFGSTALLWMCRVVSGRHAVAALAITGAVLVATHTRTALLATLVGLVVAAASLFLGHVRVRRVSALTALAGIFATTFFASELVKWSLRGQSPQEASQLTGRTKVWSAVFDVDRPRITALFGRGPSDQSFNGLPIDSNWVATYLDQGWFGMVVQGAILLLLLMTAATRQRGPHRAVALFLVLYCLTASFTETGLGTASPYILDLAVAAALLAAPAQGSTR
jgi:hypothetical protein